MYIYVPVYIFHLCRPSHQYLTILVICFLYVYIHIIIDVPSLSNSDTISSIALFTDAVLSVSFNFSSKSFNSIAEK